MTIRNFDALFAPQSVAVIGASVRAGSLGAVLMRNVVEGGFAGPIYPVHPHAKEIAGLRAYPDVAALPETPDLAVIATPPATVPALTGTLAERGTRAAVVITAGFSEGGSEEGKRLQEAMLEAARPTLTRIVGPNCLGILVPGIGLNASFAHVAATPGRIAFVSQSGALCTVVLDWARARGIGFSHFVSIGDQADVDFGDMVDYLAGLADVDAILLYIEGVTDARKFMSATRAAARNKPVIAIKSGRMPEGARAATSHSGALAGADAVYDAAFRRAGMVRVYALDELFDAVEAFAAPRRLRGNRLAIVSNGGGPGVLATDALTASGGRLASLAPTTLARLDDALPATWSRANPVDLIGDAPPDRYTAAIDAVAADPGVDAVLVMNCPVAIASSTDGARATIEAAARSDLPFLTAWLGESAAAESRQMFAAARIPTYDTPERAVRAFLYLDQHRCNQETLMQTPSSLSTDVVPDADRVRRTIQAVLDSGRSQLGADEAASVLEAYGVPIAAALRAATALGAGQAAEKLGVPVAVKLMSPDITHKSDVGGVVLGLEGAEAVRAAAEAMAARVASLRPEARIDGFLVQAMAVKPDAFELLAGISTDPLFGPVIVFGEGGTAVEVVADTALALPPLNPDLAGEVMERTRIRRRLKGYRNRPAADLAGISATLVKISQLVVDHPELVELDINPLLADENGVLAVDARIRVERRSPEERRLAIRPYPRELEAEWTLRGGLPVNIRPIRPEDENLYRGFMARLEPEDVRFRFFAAIRALPHWQLARLTQIDYDREMAFVAIGNEDGRPALFGVGRLMGDPDGRRAEYAVVVRSNLKGQGLGYELMRRIVDYARLRRYETVFGMVMRENRAMLKMAEEFGFDTRPNSDYDVVEVVYEIPGASS